MLPIRTILHPTDFSTYSRHAWDVACALARDHGARILLLHVQQIPVSVYGEFGAMGLEPTEMEALTKQLAEFQAPPDVAVERSVVQDEPATTIVRFAKDKGCDLIVMGTHGRTGLGRLLMGSVAEQVIRRAPCPVLTLRSAMPEVARVRCEEAEAAPATV